MNSKKTVYDAEQFQFMNIENYVKWVVKFKIL